MAAVDDSGGNQCHGDRVMTLPGPSRRITVEPIRAPLTPRVIPAPAPRRPEPERPPAPQEPGPAPRQPDPIRGR